MSLPIAIEFSILKKIFLESHTNRFLNRSSSLNSHITEQFLNFHWQIPFRANDDASKSFSYHTFCEQQAVNSRIHPEQLLLRIMWLFCDNFCSKTALLLFHNLKRSTRGDLYVFFLDEFNDLKETLWSRIVWWIEMVVLILWCHLFHRIFKLSTIVHKFLHMCLADRKRKRILSRIFYQKNGDKSKFWMVFIKYLRCVLHCRETGFFLLANHSSALFQ